MVSESRRPEMSSPDRAAGRFNIIGELSQYVVISLTALPVRFRYQLAIFVDRCPRQILSSQMFV